jgi:alkyl hydroperoxide reductase subunit D
MSQPISLEIETLYASKTSTIARDLKLNLNRLLEEGALAPVEATLALLAVSQSVGHTELKQIAKKSLGQNDLTPEQIQEAVDSAAIMGMLNTYYSFRYKVTQGNEANSQDYQNAGLRMTALARPALGKERFEKLAFAVSVLNGCESCIRAHEKALKDLGVAANQIHDLAKIAAVVKGLKSLE